MKLRKALKVAVSSQETSSGKEFHPAQNWKVDMLGRSKSLAMFTAAVAVCATLAVGASPAGAEPNPCQGRSGDSGTGSQSSSLSNGLRTTRVWGTWYNCAHSGQADRVKIVVSWGNDGQCITAPPGQETSYTFTQSWPSWQPAPTFRKWQRC